VRFLSPSWRRSPRNLERFGSCRPHLHTGVIGHSSRTLQTTGCLCAAPEYRWVTMSHLRSFRAKDLFSFNNVNLDNWTETYSISFYLNYIAQWPDLCFVQKSPSGRTMGYVIGKGEGKDDTPRMKERHGHVTAITVAPEYRRLGLAEGMMKLLEDISANVYQVSRRIASSLRGIVAEIALCTGILRGLIRSSVQQDRGGDVRKIRLQCLPQSHRVLLRRRSRWHR
jgi:GNAT superfamily N-acetyltransferase